MSLLESMKQFMVSMMSKQEASVNQMMPDLGAKQDAYDREDEDESFAVYEHWSTDRQQYDLQTRIEGVYQHSVLVDDTISELILSVPDSQDCEFFTYDQAYPSEWNGNESDEYDITMSQHYMVNPIVMIVKANLDAGSILSDTSARVNAPAMRCKCIGFYSKRYDSELDWYSTNLSSISVCDTVANIARYHTAMMLKQLQDVAEFVVYQPLREHSAAEAPFHTVYHPFVGYLTSCCWRKERPKTFFRCQFCVFDTIRYQHENISKSYVVFEEV